VEVDEEIENYYDDEFDASDPTGMTNPQ